LRHRDRFLRQRPIGCCRPPLALFRLTMPNAALLLFHIAICSLAVSNSFAGAVFFNGTAFVGLAWIFNVAHVAHRRLTAQNRVPVCPQSHYQRQPSQFSRRAQSQPDCPLITICILLSVSGAPLACAAPLWALARCASMELLAQASLATTSGEHSSNARCCIVAANVELGNCILRNLWSRSYTYHSHAHVTDVAGLSLVGRARAVSAHGLVASVLASITRMLSSVDVVGFRGQFFICNPHNPHKPAPAMHALYPLQRPLAHNTTTQLRRLNQQYPAEHVSDQFRRFALRPLGNSRLAVRLGQFALPFDGRSGGCTRD